MFELLEKVRLKDFITSNGGLDFTINPSSSNLSGGEKQRLLLALYLSKDYEVFIFDEITSNIDKESEAIILSLIQELSKDKIIILISHRLKNTLLSNHIYVISEKKLVQSGSPEELLNTQGEFQTLYLQQTQLEEAL